MVEVSLPTPQNTAQRLYAVEFITNRQLYEKVLLEKIPSAKRFVWIATADIKDLYIQKGERFVPFLELLADLVKKHVSIRLIHAKEPGPAFRKDFDRYPSLIDGMERILCPRVHFKSIVIDGKFAYTGSANLTGAGMGAKTSGKRNFENGILTADAGLIGAIMDQFDAVWIGKECTGCKRKEFCAEPIDGDTV